MKRVIHYLPTLFITLGIFYASILHKPSPSWPTFHHADKVAHIIMYSILAFVVYLDMKRDNIGFKVSIFISLFYCFLYGGIMEIMQSYLTSSRIGDWLDWMADCAGATFSLILASLLWKHRQKEITC